MAASSAAAAPAPQPICKTTVAAKGKRWTYQGTGGVACKFMRTTTQQFVAKKIEPEGWSCTRVRTRGTCHADKGDQVFVFYVAPKTKG
ncbi:MAG: hypothetical protein QOJ46_1399 [bacterium]|nr:hypothetical protein [Solirubrobacteraceae bacterium]